MSNPTTLEKLEEHVARLVSAAPPLTQETAERIAEILRGAR